jgi:hypothetical protein
VRVVGALAPTGWPETACAPLVRVATAVEAPAAARRREALAAVLGRLWV